MGTWNWLISVSPNILMEEHTLCVVPQNTSPLKFCYKRVTGSLSIGGAWGSSFMKCWSESTLSRTTTRWPSTKTFSRGRSSSQGTSLRMPSPWWSTFWWLISLKDTETWEEVSPLKYSVWLYLRCERYQRPQMVRRVRLGWATGKKEVSSARARGLERGRYQKFLWLPWLSWGIEGCEILRGSFRKLVK